MEGEGRRGMGKEGSRMIFSRDQDCADDLIRAIAEALQVHAARQSQLKENAALNHNYSVALDAVAEAFRHMKWATEE